MWQRAEVDGVPVFWAPGPAPLSGSLVFRVGGRDETVRTAGVTHLVEHLAMSVVGRRRHQYNASVDLTFTEFSASGQDGSVVSFLHDVCRALSSLPLERLRTEAKVLAAEQGSAEHPAVTEHLRERYGVLGVGLSDVSPPALDQLSEVEISDYAARHFTRQNAVLVLSGPPPDDLRLPLPDGTQVGLPNNPHLDVDTPRWFALTGPATSVSFAVAGLSPQEQEAALTVLRIALERAEDEVRHRHGWVYEIDFVLVSTPGQTIACFYADPPDEHADDVLRELLAILRDLRDTGPTPAELTEDLAGYLEHLDDPRSGEAEAQSVARDHLLGEPTLHRVERLKLREALTIDDCLQVLARLDDTLLVGMPPEVEPKDPGLKPLPQYSATSVDGRKFKRSVRGTLYRVPRGAYVTIADEGISFCLPEGPVTILWPDLVGVARHPEGARTTLLGADGRYLTVSADWFRDGKELMALIDARSDDKITFTDRSDDE